MLREQRTILDSEQDADLLRTGLARLTNLKRISVLDRFANPHYQWYIPNDLQWYQGWTSKNFGFMTLPTRWERAEDTDNGTSIRSHPWIVSGYVFFGPLQPMLGKQFDH